MNSLARFTCFTGRARDPYHPMSPMAAIIRMAIKPRSEALADFGLILKLAFRPARRRYASPRAASQAAPTCPLGVSYLPPCGHGSPLNSDRPRRPTESLLA